MTSLIQFYLFCHSRFSSNILSDKNKWISAVFKRIYDFSAKSLATTDTRHFNLRITPELLDKIC